MFRKRADPKKEVQKQLKEKEKDESVNKGERNVFNELDDSTKCTLLVFFAAIAVNFAQFAADVCASPEKYRPYEADTAAKIDPLTYKPKWFKLLLHTICVDLLQQEEELFESTLPLWFNDFERFRLQAVKQSDEVAPSNIKRENGKVDDIQKGMSEADANDDENGDQDVIEENLSEDKDSAERKAFVNNNPLKPDVKQLSDATKAVIQELNNKFEKGTKLEILQAVLLAALVKFNGYDARVRVFIKRAAYCWNLSDDELCSLERKISSAIASANSTSKKAGPPQTSFVSHTILDPELQKDVIEHKRFEDGDDLAVDNGSTNNTNTVDKIIPKESDSMRRWRYIKIGTAAVVGGTLVGLTGGLAAPALGAGIAALGSSIGFTTAAGLGTFAASGTGLALATTLFGATGAGLHGYKMSKRLSTQLKEFFFYEIQKTVSSNKATSAAVNSVASPEVESRMSLFISVHGWLSNVEDIPSFWCDAYEQNRELSWIDNILNFEEHYYLIWERKLNADVGKYFEKFAMDQAINFTINQALKNTVLATVMAAFAFPGYFIKLASVLDNPWILTINKAKIAGKELANALINKDRQHKQANKYTGNRPVSLYGYSAGAVAIFYCLLELHNYSKSLQTNAESDIEPTLGIIEDVFFIGAPLIESADDYMKARSVVAGRFVNCYSSKDWILSMLYRSSTSIFKSVAGLSPISHDNLFIENVNLARSRGPNVKFHYEYGRHTTHLKIAKHLNIFPMGSKSEEQMQHSIDLEIESTSEEESQDLIDFKASVNNQQ